MTRRRPAGEVDAFSEAMRDVERLEGSRQTSPPRRSRRSAGEAAQAPGFTLSTEQKRHYGRRDDVSDDELQALRDGKLRPANRLDMHGMSEEAARDRIFRFLRQASKSGLSCVALVHGRGLRSPDGPVLKAAVPRWLTQLPLAREVGAFASAPRDQGGDGVTLVLLKR